jgi:hypothetical protein
MQKRIFASHEEFFAQIENACSDVDVEEIKKKCEKFHQKSTENGRQ